MVLGSLQKYSVQDIPDGLRKDIGIYTAPILCHLVPPSYDLELIVLDHKVARFRGLGSG